MSTIRRGRIPARLLAFVMGLAILPSNVGAAESHPTIRKGHAHPYYALKSVNGGDPFVLDMHRGKKVIMLHLAPWDAESSAQLPVWNEFAKAHADDSIVMVGIVHDLFADRAELFAKWKPMAFPAYHDCLNGPDARRMARAVCVDEFGIVQEIVHDPKGVMQNFVSKEFKLDRAAVRPPVAALPDFKYTKRVAAEARRCAEYIAHGDACLFEPADVLIVEAIDAYQRALGVEPKDSAAAFRLGTAYYKRFFSERREAGDLGKAFDAWSVALRSDPRNEVTRERLLEFAATSDKRVSTCGWVSDAMADVHGGSLEPAPMAIELAQPSANFKPATESPAPPPELPDANTAMSVEIGIVRVPDTRVPGLVNCVVAMIPTSGELAGGQVVKLWVTPTPGVDVGDRLVECELAQAATSRRPVMMSVAARLNDDNADAKHALNCVAVFKLNGAMTRCKFTIPISCKAPELDRI